MGFDPAELRVEVSSGRVSSPQFGVTIGLLGARTYFNNVQRSGDLNYGEVINPLEPWLFELIYSDKDRKCAGSRISDRHVLTARLCVDAKGPTERSEELLSAESIKVKVRYGPRT